MSKKAFDYLTTIFLILVLSIGSGYMVAQIVTLEVGTLFAVAIFALQIMDFIKEDLREGRRANDERIRRKEPAI